METKHVALYFVDKTVCFSNNRNGITTKFCLINGIVLVAAPAVSQVLHSHIAPFHVIELHRSNFLPSAI